jgi:uncharacterized protein
MKKSRFSYNEWKCITDKKLKQIRNDDEVLKGYIGLMNINEVSESQIWKFHGIDITVCDKQMKWLSILPDNEYYCITAMINKTDEIELWYIDMIADMGIDNDGIVFFHDLYLDLVVYPNGEIVVDDMDELEDALKSGEINTKQFDLAISSSNNLQSGILTNINEFMQFTNKCYQRICNR